MKRLVLVFILASGAAQAGPIGQACLGSERAAGNRAVCSCIQAAADQMLSTRDQRLAASFFSDPHLAQEVRQSDRRTHEVFWKRYRAFGQFAEARCN